MHFPYYSFCLFIGLKLVGLKTLETCRKMFMLYFVYKLASVIFDITLAIKFKSVASIQDHNFHFLDNFHRADYCCITVISYAIST